MYVIPSMRDAFALQRSDETLPPSELSDEKTRQARVPATTEKKSLPLLRIPADFLMTTLKNMRDGGVCCPATIYGAWSSLGVALTYTATDQPLSLYLSVSHCGLMLLVLLLVVWYGGGRVEDHPARCHLILRSVAEMATDQSILLSRCL
uniref:Uncharacterized protein n=1 Tax=Anopheles culicifacies TaxID=139723 RepID=A0A182M1L4_9DIPT